MSRGEEAEKDVERTSSSDPSGKCCHLQYLAGYSRHEGGILGCCAQSPKTKPQKE